MKVMAFNGSPRKSGNTATLLERALAGAAAKGAETKLVHLYDITFTGCRGCYSCKLKDGKSYGRCATRDGITPLLEEVAQEAGAIILGAPIYIGSITGEMKSFFERLTYPYLVYDKEGSTLFPRKIPSAFIYTMGADEEGMKSRGYLPHIALHEQFLRRIFGSTETLCSVDTIHTDYSKIVGPQFDVAKKERHYREVFPLDCQKAYDLGARMAAA
jgi:multimeric flavodoxin WrbA